MAHRISIIWPLLIITIACIGLVEGGYLLLEKFVLEPTSQTAVADPEPENILAKTSLEKISDIIGDYRIILERNLFGSLTKEESGEKDEAENKDEKPLEATTLNIILMGTAVGDEGTVRAFILDKKSQKQELYEPGDVVQGGTIKEVLRGKVILTVNGRDEILDMSEAARVRPTLRQLMPEPQVTPVNTSNQPNVQTFGGGPAPDRRIRRVRRSVFGAGSKSLPGQRPGANVVPRQPANN